eukprot:evm.model.scf_1708.2 EVM.evm.TU.scf_1708.2   scf_1708:9036-10882(-)
MAMVHPEWTGDVKTGYDAALLRVPKELDVPRPSLEQAEPGKQAAVQAVRLGDALETANFQVLPNSRCPLLVIEGDQSFCAFSHNASMHSGDSGTPFLLSEHSLTNERIIPPSTEERDKVFGIASFSNYSSLEGSGIGATSIASVKKWIEESTRPKVPSARGSNAVGVMAVAVLSVVR